MHAQRGRTGRRLATIAVGTALAVGLLAPVSGAASPRAERRGATASARPYVYYRTPRYLFREVTGVPITVFNAVGVRSPTIPVTAPSILTHQPSFTYVHGGRQVPGAFFYGAEYCPFCAVTRWGLIVALSRFGKFNLLYNMYSSATDYAPNTPTFTFYKGAYRSPYLHFRGYEVVGPTPGSSLMTTPPRIAALVKRYDPDGSFPFYDVGNLQFVLSSAFDPIALVGRTRLRIAGDLRNPRIGVTDAIIASANYLSAGICAADGQRPARVCRSTGVGAADAALHLPG